MRLKSFQFLAFFVGFLWSSGAVNAQTRIWGVGTTNGIADAEFQSNFVQATTAGNYSATQWTALTVNESGGTVMPGNAYWTRSLTGISQGAFVGTLQPATSASQANGVAIFDSDFMDNAGVASAPGTGTSPAAHRGELISPQMDLSGATDSALIVEFYSFYRFLQLSELTVSLSVDDGTSWGTPVSIPTLQPTASNASTQGIVRAFFLNETAGISNLTQCRLKFVFDGRLYFSIIDDISVQIAPEYDIAMGVADPDAPTYYSVGNMIRIGGNANNPLMNIDPTDRREWFWGAKVVNNGSKPIVPSDAPTLYCSIDFTDAITGTQTANVYLDTIVATDTLSVNDRNGIGLVKAMREIDFIISNGAGRYNVTYWAAHNKPDGTTTNDTVRHSFVIRDDVGGTRSHYLSKARTRNSDDRVFARTQIFPGGSPHSAFEYGSLFYFPHGTRDSIKIDSVDFAYYVPQNFSGAATQTLFANVYQFVDGSNGAAANGFITGDELTQVGIAPLELNGLGTTVATGSYGMATFKNFVDASSGGTMTPFADGGFYYFSILMQPSLTGGVASFRFNDVPIHGVDNLNYAMNIGTTTTTAPISVSTMKVVDAAGATNWYAGFTGFDEVPSIGIHLSINPVISGTTTIWETEGTALTVYPNPTTNRLNIDVELNTASNVQYIMTDVSGRVIYMNNSENVKKEIHQVDVSNLPTGVYFVTAKTDEGVSTEQFIKK